MRVSDYFMKNVRYLRKANGLTQKQMADILGVGIGTVSRIERGEAVRTHSGMLCQLCDAFDLPADAVLYMELEKDTVR